MSEGHNIYKELFPDYIMERRKYKKHLFVKNKDADVTECERCGYIRGEENKRGCVE